MLHEVKQKITTTNKHLRKESSIFNIHINDRRKIFLPFNVTSIICLRRLEILATPSIRPKIIIFKTKNIT